MYQKFRCRSDFDRSLNICFLIQPIENDSMSCPTFDTAVENSSLLAFSLRVIIESSPFIALTGLSMVTPCSCCLFPQKEKSEYILSANISLFIWLSAASHLKTVRPFSSADYKIIISGNGIIPCLRKAKV